MMHMMQQQQQQQGTSSTTGSRWITKASLTEARRAVTCCEFAPRHWGLRLAVGSADGCVRLYEVIDFQNLEQWPLSATLEPFNEEDGGGSGGGTTGPGTATSKSTASSNRVGSTRSGEEGEASSSSGGGGGGQHFQVGCTCLSWCNSRFEPPTLVVGGNHLVIYTYSDATRSWQALITLPGPTSSGGSSSRISSTTTPTLFPANATAVSHHQQQQQHPGVVLDVAWAPNVGRRFHWLAAAEEDQVRIYKLNRESMAYPSTNPSSSSSSSSTTTTATTTTKTGGTTTATTSKPHLSLASELPIKANAWRCQWNVTGTVLAVSGDGGVVQLFKANMDGNFAVVSTIPSSLGKVVQEE